MLTGAIVINVFSRLGAMTDFDGIRTCALAMERFYLGFSAPSAWLLVMRHVIFQRDEGAGAGVYPPLHPGRGM